MHQHASEQLIYAACGNFVCVYGKGVLSVFFV